MKSYVAAWIIGRSVEFSENHNESSIDVDSGKNILLIHMDGEKKSGE